MKIGIGNWARPFASVWRVVVFTLVVCATGQAWANLVAEWNGDLANNSVKGQCTMSRRDDDSARVVFSQGKATLTKHKDGTASQGVVINLGDFTSKTLSVVVQYSNLDRDGNGNTSLVGTTWGDTYEYLAGVNSSAYTYFFEKITSTASSLGQYSSSTVPPASGKMVVCFSGDSTNHPGMDMSYSTYDSGNGAYGAYSQVMYKNTATVNNGVFHAVTIGGSISKIGSYHRPGMVIEAVQIFDSVVTFPATARVTADSPWSALGWDVTLPDPIPDGTITYVVDVPDSAANSVTIDLEGAAVNAKSIIFNVAAGKTLTLTGTPTSSGAPIEIAGSGKVVLSSDPGCNIVVASGATLDISASTVSSAITNNGTLNADGVSFTSTITSSAGSSLNIEHGTISGAISITGAATANFTDCAINGGIDAGQNSRAVINTYGTVSFGASANNHFQYSTTFCVKSGTTTYNSKDEKKLWCTVRVEKNATLINERQDSFNWGAKSDYPIHAYIYGTLTLNQKWTVGGGGNYIHLYDGSIINGTVSNALHFNNGRGTIVAETGSSTITAPFEKGVGTISIETKSGATLALNACPVLAKSGAGTLDVTAATSVGAITINEGTVVADVVPSATVTINENGTFTLQNCDWTSGDNRFSGTGTLELKAMDDYHTYSAANSFGGTLKFATSTSAYIQYSASFANISGTPEMVLECGTESDQKKWQFGGWEDGTHSMNVKNLSGFAQIYPNYNLTRAFAFNTLQTKNTTFSGTFTQYSNSSYPTLVVRGENEADSVYSLTLTKANTTTGSLTVQDNAKVVFSSTGSWANGTVAVADGGYLEVTNSSSVASTLDLQSGGTIKIATYTTTETVGEEEVEPLHTRTITAGTVTFPDSGEAAIDISAIPDLGENETATIITASTSLDSDISKLRLVGKPYSLQVNGNSLEVINDGGLKWDSANGWGTKDVTKYSDATITVSSASDTVTLTEDMTLDTLTITGSGTVSFSSTDSETISVSNISIPAGVTVVTADGMKIAGDVTGGGVINVPANTTLTMDGVTTPGDALADRVKVTVSGTLKTKGTTTLSAANTSAAGSLIEVVDGVTTLSSLTCGLSGNITIQGDGELKFDASYDASGADQGWDYLGTSSSNTVKVYGKLNMPDRNLWLRANNTLELYQGAEVLGSGEYASFGSLIWEGNASLMAYGDAEINATITTLTDYSPVFNVAENKTLTISTAFIGQAVTITKEPKRISGGSITKAGAGTLDLTAITPTKPITIEAGTVVADVVPTAQVTINENGTFELKDCGWTGSGNVFAGAGTLYLNTRSGFSSNRITHDVSGATFSGILKIGIPSDNQVYFNGNPETQLTGIPALRLECGTENSQGQLWVGAPAAEKKFKVKNLSGWAYIVPWSKTAGIHYFDTLQTDDTTFSGSFKDWNGTAIGSGNYKTGLTVKGDSVLKSLTLAAANETTGPLEIQNNGKVIFSSSGSWLNGMTTVKEGCVLESQRDAKVAGTVTLESGATVSIVKAGGALVPFTATTVNLPATGMVYVDLSAAGITSSQGATPVMTCAVNNADSLDNLSVVGYDGDGAFSYDDVNNQIVFTPVAMDEWSYGSATWSSASVTDGGSNTIIYHDGISDVVFGAITSSPAKITLDGKRTPASVTFIGGADTTYVISGGSFEPVGTVTISSGTVKIDTDATLSKVTGAGTLEIAADRTVTLTTNTALDGIASLTGSGTLVLPAGAAPSTSGLTTLLSNANWHGTVVVSSITGDVERDFAVWGNSNSNIKMVGVEGKTKTSDVEAARTVAAGVVLDNGDGDFALKFTSILSGNQSTWTKISGSGTIVLEGDNQQVFEIRDSSGFTGSISQQANAGRLSFVDSKGSGFKAGKGMITVYDDNNTKAYIGSGATWTAGNNGIQILGTLVIKGDATLDSVSDSAKIIIVNNAKLQYDSLGTLTLGNAVEVVGLLDNNLNTSGIGTVKIAFGKDATLRDGAKLIDWSAASLAEPPAGTFEFDGDTPAYKEDNGSYYVLTKDTTGLFVREAVAATLTKSDDTVVPFATVQEAVNATINPLYYGYKYITVNVDDTTVNAVDTTLKIKYGAGVSNFTVNSPYAEYDSDGGITDGESGITTYSLAPAATTYTWVATGDGVKNWTNPANWTYGSGTPAIRCPTTCDTVVFNNGANVTLDSTMTVAGIAVNGAVSISGSAKSLNTSGNITGEGTLTLSDICLASVGAELTVSPSVNFTNDSELARVTSGKLILNGDITASGTFKSWDVTHTVNGDLSIASGVNMAIGTGLEVNGSTTFNGNFSKSQGGTLTLGNVRVAKNTAISISSGSIAITGTVTIDPGVTLTIPASGVAVGESASFVLSGRSSVLVDNGSGASGKVRTSLTDGAKVISSTTAGVTTYKVVYGTIFSVW